MKEEIKGLCGNCLNFSKRVVEGWGDTYSYKSNGKVYDREYVCIKNHKVFAHQVTVKCAHHRPKKTKKEV